jgi:hypothetical protein
MGIPVHGSADGKERVNSPDTPRYDDKFLTDMLEQENHRLKRLVADLSLGLWPGNSRK